MDAVLSHLAPSLPDDPAPADPDVPLRIGVDVGELLAFFVVHGEARPGGSKKAFQNPKTGKIVVTDDSGKKGREWRADVRAAAEPYFPEPSAEPLAVEIAFYRRRPKGHYGSGRNSHLVKDSAPPYPAVRPDVDKLSRAVLDALKGIVYHDDAQVVSKLVEKLYSDRDYAVIRVLRMPHQRAGELPLAEREALPGIGYRGLDQTVPLPESA